MNLEKVGGRAELDPPDAARGGRPLGEDYLVHQGGRPPAGQGPKLRGHPAPLPRLSVAEGAVPGEELPALGRLLGGEGQGRGGRKGQGGRQGDAAHG